MMFESLERKVVRWFPKPSKGSRLGFALQMYAQGGAAICTPGLDVGDPKMITVIQPDCDVITKLRDDPDEWGDREWALWEEHVAKVRSKIDGLRGLRSALSKLRYLSVLPFSGAVYDVYDFLNDPHHWVCFLVTLVILLILLTLALSARLLIRLLFRIWLKQATTWFSKAEWKVADESPGLQPG